MPAEVEAKGGGYLTEHPRHDKREPGALDSSPGSPPDDSEKVRPSLGFSFPGL